MLGVNESVVDGPEAVEAKGAPVPVHDAVETVLGVRLNDMVHGEQRDGRPDRGGIKDQGCRRIKVMVGIKSAKINFGETKDQKGTLKGDSVRRNAQGAQSRAGRSPGSPGSGSECALWTRQIQQSARLEHGPPHHSRASALSPIIGAHFRGESEKYKLRKRDECDTRRIESKSSILKDCKIDK